MSRDTSVITQAVQRMRGRMFRDVAWSFSARLLPFGVAAIALPVLVRELGTERIGILMLAWAVLGYFSLFDLGLGRAMTQAIAERRDDAKPEEIAEIVWVGSVLMGLLGLVGGVALWVLAPWLATETLGVPHALESEARAAFRWLAIALPAVVPALGFRGILEGFGMFRAASLLILLSGTLTFLAPLAIVMGSQELPPVVAGMALAQVVTCLAYGGVCVVAIPACRARVRFSRTWTIRLLRFGGWMTVSSIVGPLMVYIDRFVIGALRSIDEVAFYATPYEVVTKLWVVPASLCVVLFPSFSSLFAQRNKRFSELVVKGVIAVTLAMVPAWVVVLLLAEPALAWWLGPDFAREGASVARWIMLGVLINSIGQVFIVAIQAAGRPDLGAKLHLCELLPYGVLLVLLVSEWGIVGAAMAWTARVAVDTVVLAFIAFRLPSMVSSLRE